VHGHLPAPLKRGLPFIRAGGQQAPFRDIVGTLAPAFFRRAEDAKIRRRAAVRNDLDAREHGRHLQRRLFGDGNAGNGAAVAAVDQVGNLLVGELRRLSRPWPAEFHAVAVSQNDSPSVASICTVPIAIVRAAIPSILPAALCLSSFLLPAASRETTALAAHMVKTGCPP